ncbi:M28 family peptidase [bacterium]|nr:M28 family peptidase [bacterium]
MVKYKRVKILIIVFLLVMLCCSATHQGIAAEFDGNEAFKFLYKQVELGPRVPGTEIHAKAVEYYVDWFEEMGGRVREQKFSVSIPEQPKRNSKTYEVEATNIIANFGPPGKPTYLFCAHFDTRPWSDQDPNPENFNTPVPGANDGASGVAVLLELARLFAIEEPPDPIEIVLFDVEDAGVSGDNESYCLGSAYYAKHYAGSAPVGAVLLDMIGDASLEINMEYFSYNYAKSWTQYLFELAEQLNLYSFNAKLGDPVYDDHVNLIRAGIPTCNLIDFDYPYWHTVQDTPDKCSPESLKEVGDLLVGLIYGH